MSTSADLQLTIALNQCMYGAVNTSLGCLSRRDWMIANRTQCIASLSFVALLSFSVHAQPQQPKKLSVADAKDHVGELATVCGEVASTRYAAATRGKPT